MTGFCVYGFKTEKIARHIKFYYDYYYFAVFSYWFGWLCGSSTLRRWFGVGVDRVSLGASWRDFYCCFCVVTHCFMWIQWIYVLFDFGLAFFSLSLPFSFHPSIQPSNHPCNGLGFIEWIRDRRWMKICSVYDIPYKRQNRCCLSFSCWNNVAEAEDSMDLWFILLITYIFYSIDFN